MANRRNNRRGRRNKKRRINKNKLALLFIVVILFIAGAFKLTQSAISTIKNTSNNKKQTSVVESSNVVESSDNEYETLPTEVDKNINKKYIAYYDYLNELKQHNSEIENHYRDIALKAAYSNSTILQEELDDIRNYVEECLILIQENNTALKILIYQYIYVLT